MPREPAHSAGIVFVGLDEDQDLWGGGRGATAFTGHGVCTVPALATEVVEPVGAGYAFAAGFLAGLCDGTDLTRALRLGHLTAPSAPKVVGDHATLPGEDTIEAMPALAEQDRCQAPMS